MILTIFNSVKQFLALSHFELHFQVLTEAAPPNLAKQDLCEEPVRVIQSPQVSSGVSRNAFTGIRPLLETAAVARRGPVCDVRYTLVEPWCVVDTDGSQISRNFELWFTTFSIEGSTLTECQRQFREVLCAPIAYIISAKPGLPRCMQSQPAGRTIRSLILSASGPFRPPSPFLPA